MVRDRVAEVSGRWCTMHVAKHMAGDPTWEANVPLAENIALHPTGLFWRDGHPFAASILERGDV